MRDGTNDKTGVRFAVLSLISENAPGEATGS